MNNNLNIPESPVNNQTPTPPTSEETNILQKSKKKIEKIAWLVLSYA